MLLVALVSSALPGGLTFAELREREAARPPHNELPTGRTEHGARGVDEYFQQTWEAAGLRPAKTIDDAAFLRRASLALIGLPATGQEVVAFLEDTAADKRQRKVDELLVRSRYADYWGFRLRQWVVDLREVKGQGASQRNLYFYTREAMAENRSWARIARDFLTSQANLQVDGAVNFGIWLSVQPGEFADGASRFFLGTNLSCARCHDHPYVVDWTRESYWGLAAFFARTRRWKGDQKSAEFLAQFPPLSRNPASVSTLPGGDRSIDGGGGEERVIYDVDEGEMRLPDAKESPPIPPTLLGGEHPAGIDDGSRTRRERLVEWMVRPETPYLRRAAVNRFWLTLTGRGFVDSFDGFSPLVSVRHEPLLESLSREFAARDYDIKWLLRTIVLSRAFQLEHGPVGESGEDPAAETWHAAPRQRLNSDQWFDSVVRVSGEEERIYSLAEEIAPLLQKEQRARVAKRRETIAEAEKVLTTGKHAHLARFLPEPPPAATENVAAEDVLESEVELKRLKTLRNEYMKLGIRQEKYRGQLRRRMSPTSEALLRMNGELVALSLQHGTAAARIAALKTPRGRLDASFLAVLGRHPLPEEAERLRDAVGEATPASTADLLWALMQTNEFLTY